MNLPSWLAYSNVALVQNRQILGSVLQNTGLNTDWRHLTQLRPFRGLEDLEARVFGAVEGRGFAGWQKYFGV
eukprot:15111740-Alexandrium_andersonii.AAC.1